MQFKNLNVTIKAVDDASYSLRAVFSTPDPDRHGEIVDQTWVLKEYLLNPVVLFSHDHNQPPVGRIKDLVVKSGRLEGVVEFAAEQYEFANTLWKLYRDGFMRAFSVGFSPEDVVVENGVRVLKNNHLYEISTVSVPANAMALAKSKGIDVTALEEKFVEMDEKGGPGSGNHGHSGRPGRRGGSSGGSGSSGLAVSGDERDGVLDELRNSDIEAVEYADYATADESNKKISELTELHGKPLRENAEDWGSEPQPVKTWVTKNEVSVADYNSNIEDNRMSISLADDSMTIYTVHSVLETTDELGGQYQRYDVPMSSTKSIKSSDCPGCKPLAQENDTPDTPAEEVIETTSSTEEVTQDNPETPEEATKSADTIGEVIDDITARQNKYEKFNEVERIFWAFYEVYFDSSTPVDDFDTLLAEFISLLQGSKEKGALSDVEVDIAQKSIDFIISKAGRVLSAANRRKVEEAVAALNDVLDADTKTEDKPVEDAPEEKKAFEITVNVPQFLPKKKSLRNREINKAVRHLLQYKK